MEKQSNKCIIIAEAGVNHNGDLEIAKRMVDYAKKAGVDIIKFQTGIAENVISKNASKAEYQKKNTDKEENQLEMVKKILLSFEEFTQLEDYCMERNIEFLSTPFDLESIKFLDSLDMPFWKIPSGEITNYPYLVEIAKTHKPIIMSTGMCILPEIEDAIRVLRENGAGEISLLHCTTEYPAPFEEVNLRAMDVLRKKFGVKVGYSDHTVGIEVPIAAVAMGAEIIEKHFTLDRNMEGPDHKASLEPAKLKAMVDGIRKVEMALGREEKVVTSSEEKNKAVARKSIVAKRKICAGEVLSEENITTKRPGNGISPMKWTEVLGTKAIRDFVEDELIEI